MTKSNRMDKSLIGYELMDNKAEPRTRWNRQAVALEMQQKMFMSTKDK